MARDNWMIARAAGLRTAAMARRNKGLHTGASAKGWNVKRPDLPDEWASHVHIARRELSLDNAAALNDFRAACLNGPNWEEELNAIPF